MAILLQDLALSVRQLRQRPLFTLTAVLTLAIGIGVNTVAFTVVNGLLFKGFSISAADKVGRIITIPGGDESGYASLPEYGRFADATRGALDLAAEGRLAMAWRHDGVTTPAWVLMVTPNYFSMVKAAPIAGRIAVTGAVDGRPTAVIGERFWRKSLNAPSLAGLTLRLNNVDVNVAGVLPESYTGPGGMYSPDVWLPLDDLRLFNTAAALLERDTRWLFVMGRLMPGAGVPEIQSRVDTAVAEMAHDWPDSHRQRSARFRMLRDGNSELRGLTIASAILMGIISLVLLLACFNVANLLLARAVERERDLGVRKALGAGTGRLIRLVVTEGLVIATLAGIVALVLANWTQSMVTSFAIPIDQPQHIEMTPDGAVVAVVGLLVLIAGVLPGLWPAFVAARVDAARVLASQGSNAVGGRPSPMRRWLVGAQVAGSTAFLAIAALFAQTYGNLALADFGFDKDHLLLADFDPASHGYGVERTQRYVDALVARAGALPGITRVAVADRAPFFIGFDRKAAVASAGAPCEGEACPKVSTMAVGPGYFKTMGIPIAIGREFETAGRLNEAIVNRPLAAQHWRAGGGVGETLRIGPRGIPVTVVGITAKTHTRGLDREAPTLYVPLDLDHLKGQLTLVARTASTADALMRPFADAAQALDPNVSMSSVKTMEQRMAVQLWPFRTVGWLFSICGGLALVLATVGLAGVVIYTVNRRLREFGVRLAIGARPRDLVIDVLAGSARLLLPGLVTGILIAAAIGRLVRVALFGVNVLNPLTYVAVALLECVIVVIACVSPALRASRIDPIAALRAD